MFASMVVLLLLSVLVFFAVRSMVRNKRKGQCVGGCAHCSAADACGAVRDRPLLGHKGDGRKEQKHAVR